MNKIALLVFLHISWYGYCQNVKTSTCEEIIVEGFYVRKYSQMDYLNLKVKKKRKKITFTQQYDYKIFTFFIPKDSIRKEEDWIRKLQSPYIKNAMPIYEIADGNSYLAEKNCNNIDTTYKVKIPFLKPKMKYIDSYYIYEIYYLKGKWLKYSVFNNPMSLRFFDGDMYALRYIDKSISNIDILSLATLITFEEYNFNHKNLTKKLLFKK